MSEKLHITAPATPGATPSVVATANTIDEARRKAVEFSWSRRDLRGSDVRIELADGGQLIEYAGVGR